jgi:hypothetical protein
MSLKIAQANAWSLAKTLMVCVILFQTADGYGVMVASEFDGPTEAIVHEYDPFA